MSSARCFLLVFTKNFQKLRGHFTRVVPKLIFRGALCTCHRAPLAEACQSAEGGSPMARQPQGCAQCKGCEGRPGCCGSLEGSSRQGLEGGQTQKYQQSLPKRWTWNESQRTSQIKSGGEKCIQGKGQSMSKGIKTCGMSEGHTRAWPHSLRTWETSRSL